MSFTIYYDDERISLFTSMENLYTLGVICIVDYHDTPHIHEGSDYYVWQFREDGWTGVDIFGLWDYLQSYGMKKVLFGRTVSNSLFDRIHNRAYMELCKARQEASK